MRFKHFEKSAESSVKREKIVLWWGRHDASYSRNSIVRSLMESLGWTVRDFRPLSSDFGYMESVLRFVQKPDLVWVGNFRQRDVVHASRKAKEWGVPMIFDPLISAYEKEIFEKKIWPEAHKKAGRLRLEEKKAFSGANLVVADTEDHAEFFRQILGVDKRKTRVLYVGADTALFRPEDHADAVLSDIPEILFYGSFLELHGVDVIVEAARMSGDLGVRWVLLGDGPCKEDLYEKTKGQSNVAFEEPIPYSMLPARIAKADILLGVFGETKKSGMVIPNKIFQAMAMAKPVVTRRAASYPEEILKSDVIGWVEPGSASDLSEKIRSWLSERPKLGERGKMTKALHDRFFSRDVLLGQLSDIIETAFSNKKKGY